MNKKILVVHPTGNQNSRAAARGLADAGQLYAFITALSLNASVLRWLPGSLLSEVSRRDFSEIKGKVVGGASLREGLRLLASKLKLYRLTQHEIGVASVDQVYHAMDRFATNYLKKNAQEILAVYGYEDGALETFETAKALGIKCVYELPIGYWRVHRELNGREASFNPEWAKTWAATADSPEKLARKDRELQLADHIIVASAFTQKTLEAYPGALAPVTVLPYGFPKTIGSDDRTWYKPGGKLKVLYVGELSQRKGLSYMAEALARLTDKVTFSYIGAGRGVELMKSALPTADYLGTMPHAEVLKQMREHDVLLFPSLFEGFGMVITEAMSQGMVVIATDHTALPDIADGAEAICVPVNSSTAIEEALIDLAAHPEKVRQYGENAMAKAESYRWREYEEAVVALMQNALSPDENH